MSRVQVLRQVRGGTLTRWMPGQHDSPRQGQRAGSRGAKPPGVLRDPLVLVITALTLLGLGLRLFYLLHDGFLLAVTEYDDGPYFGSAVRLLQGVLPYRDFVLVQPPGITLLMVPSALVAKTAGTAVGLASGRVLTVLAGAASVPLTGLLVRHRGLLATVGACGLMTVYPDAVAAAHTVLVEPWLVMFVLLATVLAFDGDHLASRRRRLAWAGVASGFAGVIEAWAIVPTVIMLVICLAPALPSEGWRERRHRAAAFAGGVAAGFLVPVTPFLAAGPAGFYRSLVVAQIGPRHGFVPVPPLDRFYDLTGLADVNVNPATLRALVNIWFIHTNWPLPTLVWVLTAALALIVTGAPALLILRNQPPTPLEWFALASTWLVTAMFLWPGQFHYHFAAFLVPFLALAITLPLARLLTPCPRRQPTATPARRHGPLLPAAATATAAALITVFAAVQADTESRLHPNVTTQTITAADRLIPPGSCVISDSAALLQLADRFNSTMPGCTLIDDGLGTDLALSGGLTPQTGAAAIPAVAHLWLKSFGHAQFLWLTGSASLRIPFTPALRRYVHHHFKLIYTDPYGDQIYRQITAPTRLLKHHPAALASSATGFAPTAGQAGVSLHVWEMILHKWAAS